MVMFEQFHSDEYTYPMSDQFHLQIEMVCKRIFSLFAGLREDRNHATHMHSLRLRQVLSTRNTGKEL